MIKEGNILPLTMPDGRVLLIGPPAPKPPIQPTDEDETPKEDK